MEPLLWLHCSISTLDCFHWSGQAGPRWSAPLISQHSGCVHQKIYSAVLPCSTLLRSRMGRPQVHRRNVKRFRGGLVFKAHILVYHATLGLRVIMKKSTCASRATVAPHSLFSDLNLHADNLHMPPQSLFTIPFIWIAQACGHLQGYLAHKKPPHPRDLQ